MNANDILAVIPIELQILINIKGIMWKSLKQNCLVLTAIFLIASCTAEQPGQTEQQVEQREDTDTNFTNAVAVVHPTDGNDVTGTVTFEQSDDGIRVQATLEGLEEGDHGFHIHQYGDCTADDGTSAGGHYNPTEEQHGAPEDDERHVGDMGNITADENGNATIDYVDSKIELNGKNSILGRGVVIHGGQDDLSSQPSGDAGPRVGCGVIGVANTEM